MDKDLKFLEKYQQKKPWGMSLCVDLYNCDPEFIRSEEKIKEFTIKLCSLIKVRRFGKAQIIHFGEKARVSGFSLTQLIETSLLSGHFANNSSSAYVDIFSCREFPPYKTSQFCKKFFKAKKMRVKVNFRY